MMPRVITRTHYQVDEPAYVRVLIRDCSSPTTSDYPERIARRLEERLKALHIDFNLAAAKYCVDLAKGLNLLSENNFWTWSAQVLRLIAPERNNETSLDPQLSLEERIFFFRVFLEYDGAALIFLARKASLVEKIPEPAKDWNDLANEMMVSVYSCYLDIVTDIRDRTAIRQLLSKRRRQPYSGKSGAHQCFLHLKAMTRVGLLQSRGREYCKHPSSAEPRGTIYQFLRNVPDFTILENILSKNDWPKIASAVLTQELLSGERWIKGRILDQAHELYERVMATGVPLCSLNTLIEAIQIKQISAGMMPILYEECMKVFRQAQAENPTKIRFKVDRIGRPAFITLS
jgi:hypothetical protein